MHTITREKVNGNTYRVWAFSKFGLKIVSVREPRDHARGSPPVINREFSFFKSPDEVATTAVEKAAKKYEAKKVKEEKFERHIKSIGENLDRVDAKDVPMDTSQLSDGEKVDLALKLLREVNDE